jgi:hypothetical protein
VKGGSGIVGWKQRADTGVVCGDLSRMRRYAGNAGSRRVRCCATGIRTPPKPPAPMTIDARDSIQWHSPYRRTHFGYETKSYK